MPTIPVKSAVVGTANANTKEQNAQALLQQAGIVALQNQAAYLPVTSAAPLPPLAPQDQRQTCPPEAALQLAWLLKHQQAGLQTIWIKKLIEVDLGLPYEWIVPILHGGIGSRIQLGDAPLLELLGARGKWMAEQQEEWGWIFKPSPFRKQKELQEEPNPTDTKILAELRRRNPDEGRIWLIRNWDELRHDGRRWHYLETLRDGLDKRDEIWLMNIAAGLHDGASDLLHEAQIALQLLSLLPKQALVDDLCQKVFGTLHLAQDTKTVLDFVWSVSYEGQLVYKAHIGLTNLMNIFDWRLSLDAILKLIPMSAWIGHFGVAPETLLRAASQGSHAGVFADAWGKRILYEQNTAFAMAWLRCFGKMERLGAGHPFPDTAILDLFELLSWEELVAILSDYVE